MNTVVEELFVHPWWVDVLIILGMLTICGAITVGVRHLWMCTVSKLYEVDMDQIDMEDAKRTETLQDMATPMHEPQRTVIHEVENSLGIGSIEPVIMGGHLDIANGDLDTEYDTPNILPGDDEAALTDSSFNSSGRGSGSASRASGEELSPMSDHYKLYGNDVHDAGAGPVAADHEESLKYEFESDRDAVAQPDLRGRAGSSLRRITITTVPTLPAAPPAEVPSSPLGGAKEALQLMDHLTDAEKMQYSEYFDGIENDEDLFFDRDESGKKKHNRAGPSLGGMIRNLDGMMLNLRRTATTDVLDVMMDDQAVQTSKDSSEGSLSDEDFDDDDEEEAGAAGGLDATKHSIRASLKMAGISDRVLVKLDTQSSLNLGKNQLSMASQVSHASGASAASMQSVAIHESAASGRLSTSEDEDEDGASGSSGSSSGDDDDIPEPRDDEVVMFGGDLGDDMDDGCTGDEDNNGWEDKIVFLK